MAQYEKLINLSLLNQFLTKAKTIFAPKITASGILKGDGQGGVSAATAGTDYATPAQSLALGLTGASVGDLVRVNAVDSNGKPTSWKKVHLNEIKCNKNYLINHYMVGGGSQLGDGVFPINQRGQTAYSNNGYGLDMWYSLGPKNITASGTEFDVTHAANSNNILQQPINPDFFVGKTISLSALFSNNTLIYLENIVFNGTDVRSADGAFTGFIIGIYVNSYPQSSQTVFRAWATQQNKNVTLIDCKLELGSEQTLCHNEGTAENPVWVLNELPDYEEELRKCKLYFERIGGTYNTFGSGTGDSNNRAAFLTYVSPKSSAFTGNPVKVPSANISASGTFYINGSGIGGKNVPVTNVFAYKELTYNGTFRFQADTSGSLTTGYGYTIQSKDTAAYIDISCEP